MKKEMIGKYIEAFINGYINQCFRDQADKDYLSARLCFKKGLLTNFDWLAQQCLEKYLKAIMLYQRMDTCKIGHEISKAFKLLVSNFPRINVSSWDERLEGYNLRKESLASFIGRIERLGLNRYGSFNTYSWGDELYKLDCAVWVLSSFCQSGNINKMPIYGPGLTSYLGKVWRNKKVDQLKGILLWKNIRINNYVRRIQLRLYGRNNPIESVFMRARGEGAPSENKQIAIGVGEFITKNIRLEKNIKDEIKKELVAFQNK